MKIAIIGSGISGLSAAYLLNRKHDITLFEAADYLGGHAKTVTVKQSEKEFNIDQGFMVFNKKNYPLLSKLFQDLQVEFLPSEMSFSVKDPVKNFEYRATNFFSWFVQKRNFLQIGHYKLFFELLKFKGKLNDYAFEFKPNYTLESFLKDFNFSDNFKENFILPLCASIWSSNYKNVLNFSVIFLYYFLDNHGILDLTHKTNWLCLQGGSKSYVNKIIHPFKSKIFLSTPVLKIFRDAKKKNQAVRIVTGGGKRSEGFFDKVVIASHSDQALKMLGDPSSAEREILSKIPFKNSHVILHQDASIMPKKKNAWASWNYLVLPEAKSTLITYNVEKIQRVANQKKPFFVSLNTKELIDGNKVLANNNFAHPQFGVEAQDAKVQLDKINGVNHTYYCGAYWFNGFHEDGLKSGVKVAEKFNITL